MYVYDLYGNITSQENGMTLSDSHMITSVTWCKWVNFSAGGFSLCFKGP